MNSNNLYKNSFEREGRALAELIRRGFAVIITREYGVTAVGKDNRVFTGSTPNIVLEKIVEITGVR